MLEVDDASDDLLIQCAPTPSLLCQHLARRLKDALASVALFESAAQ